MYCVILKGRKTPKLVESLEGVKDIEKAFVEYSSWEGLKAETQQPKKVEKAKFVVIIQPQRGVKETAYANTMPEVSKLASRGKIVKVVRR